MDLKTEMISGSESYKISRSISMTSKIKSMFKRQSSQPISRPDVENNEESSAIMQEMQSVPEEFLQRRRYDKSVSASFENHSSHHEEVQLRQKTKTSRRHKTSLGAIEDLLQCPICKERLKSPRMMPCQHTFCEKCLEKRLEQSRVNTADAMLTCPLCNLPVSDRTPELLPTNLYIESLLHVMENPGEGLLRLATRNPVVSFAPLPDQTSDNEPPSSPLRSPGLPSRCSTCSVSCGKDNKCKHCKQIFCGMCWIPHVDELKNQFEKIISQLEATSSRFASRVEDFRTKVDETKTSIEKNIEARMAELMHEREERMQRLTYRAEHVEESAGEVQRRLTRVADEVKEQKNGSYDALTDNTVKVKMFISLHREATELMQLESSWNPEVVEADSLDNSKQSQIDLVTVRGDVDLFYRRKVFTPKLVANRELVQRPSGMAHDPWRDHVFVSCPGARQIVVLDRKHKLFKRYQNTEMMAPQGLAYLDTTEELFVTDKWKHCIFVFNRKGEVVRQMCKKGQGESQLSCPEGLALHASQNLLYVADTGNDRIQILELDGTFRGFVGPTERQANGVTKSGKVQGIVVNHLNQPTDVAVTDNCIVVADCGNHKVKIFNQEGVLVHTIGGSGTQKRFFRSPEVVAVDNKGNIVVGDSGNARVQIFSPRGDLLRVLGGRGSKTNTFGWISGLLIKNNFDMMITDSKNNAVKLFSADDRTEFVRVPKMSSHGNRASQQPSSP